MSQSTTKDGVSGKVQPLNIRDNFKHRSFLKKLPYPYEVREQRKRFQQLREAVFERRPVLREIIQKYGKATALEYAKRYVEGVQTVPISRKQELLDIFKNLVEERLGSQVAEIATKQLKETNFVSTADHHGPLMDPYFLNANLVAGLNALNNKEKLPCVIVLSCAGVSSGNHTFPRGVTVTTPTAYNLKTLKLPFLPANIRLTPVFKCRPYTADDLKRAEKELEQQISSQNLDHSKVEKIKNIIQEVYANKASLEAKGYSEQISLTNAKLWSKMFEGSTKGTPELVYIEQETLVNRLLLECHLGKNTFIEKLLTNSDFRKKLIEKFDGIEGGFDTREKVGSLLFWALPKDSKYREQLWLEGNTLVTEDKKFQVELTAEEIKAKIQNGELMPSMLLTFLVLSFYYGVKCLGGFCQIHYLTEMKRAYLSLCSDLGMLEEAMCAAPVETKELAEDLIIAFLAAKNQTLKLATGLDLLVYGLPEYFKRLEDMSETVTVEEALNLMMPEFYLVMYKEHERVGDLAELSQQEIAKSLGFSHKLLPCASL